MGGVQRGRLLLALSVALVAITPATGRTADDFQHVAGLGPARAVTGGWEVLLADGSTVLTHGFDADREDTAPAPAATTESPIVCAPTTKPHFQAIVARPHDGPDRLAQLQPMVRTAIERASAFMDAEAKALSPTARARYRMACGADGMSVDAVALPTSATSDTFSTIVNDLRALGYSNRNAKYLIFYDDCFAVKNLVVQGLDSPCFTGGIGTIRADDRASSSNSNNYGLSYAVDAGGLGTNPSWSTLLHESGHNMGVVQLSAPNTTGAYHCIDGDDVMCYADGGPRSAEFNPVVCPDLAWDCRHDDYFHPTPPADSYLATHWNLAASYNSFLDHGTTAKGAGRKR